MKQILTLCTVLLSQLIAMHADAQPGTLDGSFGTGGIQILQPGTVHDVGKDIIALADSSSLVCGVTYANGAFSGFLAHLNADGTVDTGFGTNGGYTIVDLGEETYFYNMQLASDGSIFVCGLAYVTYPNSVVLLMKFRPDGTPDPGFGVNGVITTAIGTGEAEAQKMVIQSDGKLVLAGRAGFGGSSDGLLLRYRDNGELDETFSGDGWLLTDAFPATGDQFNGVAVLSDGSIVAAGQVDQNFIYKTMLAKVSSDGIFDNGFAGSGQFVEDIGVSGDEAYNIISMGDQFVICGYASPTPDNRDLMLVKYNADGTRNSGFGTNGLATLDIFPNEIAFDVLMQSDGPLLLCGTTGQFGFFAPRDFVVARFTENGVVDDTFGSAGSVVTSIQPDFDDANALAIQPDGKILATGFSAGADNDLVIVRYLNDLGVGQLDAEDRAMGLTAYPVPAADRLWFSGLPSNAGGTVIDQIGREVMHFNNGQHGVDISALARGMYQVRIVEGEFVRSIAFIKN
jgi:uncharacterized delta-60 repeat protein